MRHIKQRIPTLEAYQSKVKQNLEKPTLEAYPRHFEWSQGRFKPLPPSQSSQTLLQVAGPEFGQEDKQTQSDLKESLALGGQSAGGERFDDVFHCGQTALLEQRV